MEKISMHITRESLVEVGVCPETLLKMIDKPDTPKVTLHSIRIYQDLNREQPGIVSS
ncbi:hypothetical protein D3C81_1996540 [compost metagenome]